MLLFEVKVNREALTLSLSFLRYRLSKAPFKIGRFFPFFTLGYIICIIGTYTKPKKVKPGLFSTDFVQIINIYFNKGNLNPLLPMTKQTISSYTKEKLDEMDLQNRMIRILLRNNRSFRLTLNSSYFYSWMNRKRGMDIVR